MHPSIRRKGGNQLKLLIVDDEKHVITAIRCLVPAKELGISQILTAQTAAEAKILLEKEKPEIAIVDIILQQQTGMNLMAFIIARKLQTQVIAVSGHSDYEYVRTMLLNGAVDYLLKPVEAKALVSSLQKAIRKAKSFASDSEVPPEGSAAMGLSTQHIRSRLHRLLEYSAASSPGEEGDFNSSLPQTADCALLYYDTDYLPVCRMEFRQDLSSFAEKVYSYFSLHACGYLVDRFNSQHEYLILIFDNDKGTHLRQVSALAADIFSPDAFPFHMGTVEKVRFPENFAKAYRLAKASFFSDDCHVVPELLQRRPQARIQEDRKALAESPKLEKRLLSLLITQNQPAFIKEAEEWLAAFWNREFVSLDAVRQLIADYHAMCARWVESLKDLYPQLVNEMQTERIRYADFTDENSVFSAQMMTAGIIHGLRQVSERVARCCTEDDLFKRIALYMEINYDQPFSQSEYAQMFHLNRDYLSRRFKQTFGEGMVSYLNRLRITHAEQMMRDPRLKIRDIAFMTGFGDEKYFTRQFKEYYHIPPSEYRAMILNEQR